MAAGAIPTAEIVAWARLRRIKISPAEAVLIDSLDSAYRNSLSDPEPEQPSPTAFLRAEKAAHDAAKKSTLKRR